MIPVGGVTAAGDTGETNTSAWCDEAARCRDESLAELQNATCFTFTSAACFPVATFTSLP